MVFANNILILIFSFVTIFHLSKQDGCVPGTVTNVGLTSNWVGIVSLVWDPPPNEQCEIDLYLVYVFIQDTDLQRTFSVKDRKVELGYLRDCEPYTFQVRQVSTENITGPIFALQLTTPPPSAADLVIVHLDLIPGDRNVTMIWSLETQWMPCVKHFMVLIYDEDTDSPRDIYTTDSSITVTDLVPCDRYLFGLRALFSLEVEGPLTQFIHRSIESVATPPQLVNIRPSTTSIDFTWNLEEYSKNRCSMSSLILDGSPHFNATYEIDDQENRTPMSVTVDNLIPNSLYVIRVTVVNSAGTSNPVLLAVQTLAN